MQKFFHQCLFYISVLFAFASHAALPVNSPTSNFTDSRPKTIYLVRHFEKEQLGMSAPNKKDPQLTEVGQKRALSLASYLKDKNITQVFSTKYQRTMQTAKPTAALFNVDVTQYNPSELSAFAERLLGTSSAQAGNILIVGHSNTTPELLQLLGGPLLTLSESDYGDLFVLNLAHDTQTNDTQMNDTQMNDTQTKVKPFYRTIIAPLVQADKTLNFID